jgi:hypothetical protein
MAKTLVTPYQLAKMLGIPSQRVYNWIQRLGCPYTRTANGDIWLDPDAVSAWNKERGERREKK